MRSACSSNSTADVHIQSAGSRDAIATLRSSARLDARTDPVEQTRKIKRAGLPGDFASMKNIAPALSPQPDKDGANQDVNVAAQDAAARSPDTASGDEAKKRAVESGTTGSKSDKGGPGDELTRSEESTAMPKPGQANDHSVIKTPEK